MLNLPIEELNKIKQRIEKSSTHKINAFSPTISPAPKSFERNEIESIEKGIDYFLQRGITELIFQKKYMGSYGDIYLAKNIEESYLVSRNGFLVNRLEKQTFIEKLKSLHSRFNWEQEGLSMAIIQCEIMPWRILGTGLVEQEFKAYLDAHTTHFEHLEKSNLYEKIEMVKASDSYKSYHADKTALSKSDFKSKYPSHVIRQYDAINDFIIKDLVSYQNGISIYTKQINHFGREGELEFKPFNILKLIFESGKEEIPNDNLSFQQVNDDEMLHLDFSKSDDKESLIQKVYDWFDSLTGEMEEGIMIKPRVCFQKGLAPALKVRNNHYLTMIYGVDFLEFYDHNMHKRKTDSKLKCSIFDWMINWELLQIPYSEIHSENYHFKNLMLDRIMGERAENQLDIRL